MDVLPAAIGDVVEQLAAAARGSRRPEDVEIGLVLDAPRRVPRRLVEVDDYLVARVGRIELALERAAHALVGAGLAEARAAREALDGGDIDLRQARGGRRRGKTDRAQHAERDPASPHMLRSCSSISLLSGMVPGS